VTLQLQVWCATKLCIIRGSFQRSETRSGHFGTRRVVGAESVTVGVVVWVLKRWLE
jgi:hypothetical protein